MKRFLLAVLVAFAAVQAQASAIVGSYDAGNCYPFGCFAANGGVVFQQVYDRSAFSGALDFDKISFFQSDAGDMDGATYTISFSTTANPLFGLDSNYANNVGSDNTLFGTFSLGGSMPSVLSFAGNMVHYDPSKGNLLMQIVVNFVDAAVDFPAYLQADYGGMTTTVLLDYGWGGYETIGGLVTRFDNTRISIPEPAGIALFGLALAGLCLAWRRRFAN